MRCETCDGGGGWRVNNRGQRIIGVPWPGQVAGWHPCPTCGGTGSGNARKSDADIKTPGGAGRKLRGG
jgi:hypothetical protein